MQTLPGSDPEPFTVQASPEALADLRARLRATRWPDAPEDAWSLGTDLAYLRDLVPPTGPTASTWGSPGEGTVAVPALPRPARRLGHPLRRARPGRQPGRPGAAAGPLCHGWPDSFWRYTKVIPLLIDPGAHGGDPADAFDVVRADMPGYGYSDRPTGPPLDTIAVARLWARLLDGLGYQRFGAVGGDIGAGVSNFLALNYPERVTAVHRMDGGGRRYWGPPRDARGARRDADMAAWSAAEGAYMAMHRTKPQTAAVGLTDSPAGLAAWIVEKMRGWSDCGGDISGPSRWTRSSPTSRSTGSPRPSARRCGCITRTARSRPRSMPAGSRSPPVSRSSPPIEPGAADVAGAHHQPRPVHAGPARRALRAARRTRVLRGGTARLLPPLPDLIPPVAGPSPARASFGSAVDACGTSGTSAAARTFPALSRKCH